MSSRWSSRRTKTKANENHRADRSMENARLQNNRRTALVLAAIALAFFIGVMLKYVLPG